ALDSWGAFAAYRHVWNDQWRSSVVYGYLDVDNDSDSGQGVRKTAYSVRGNLIFSPVKQLSFGFELSYANSENEAGDDGDFTRGQFMAKYAF
ncbi:MAG: porin, partial [Gammaproteobacteria bacterium]